MQSARLLLARAFEGCDELGQMLVGDPAQLADLDAAELTSPQQVVHLVAADVQHLRYLLDCVRFHVPGLSPSSFLPCSWVRGSAAFVSGDHCGDVSEWDPEAGTDLACAG